MTRVYHIVKFKDGSAYVLFDGCNWKCSYCVWREVTRWSLCLPEERRKELDMLWINGRVRYLRLEEVVSMLKRNSVKFAFFGGGEPTLDPELKPLLRALSREGIKVWLVTNGENLDEEIINLVEGVTFSIKALDRELHRRITGVSNEKVLENLRRFGKSGKIVAETVFVPGLVECDEIERIARFIASINPSIPLRVDPLVQGASVEKVDECIERITEVKAYRIKVKGKIEPPEVIYPVI
ncbi:co-factor modifying protein [Pyrococcus sp. NA2]|uniref:radical SAM protein n=1 Tax=Pyrococcus sp. (strain NA2) TaxID=342949 RepID=UPI000209A996|nr:radical SAM protein [Pyrococcus sp. NA2]AEC51908.1 co-factor modifying protein [Pyrococcus sp. NA2]